MGYIIFNGRSSKDFGLEVETFPTYDIPERNYESVTIPGRNGEFLIDQKTFKNVNRSYKVSLATSERGRYGYIDRDYTYTQIINRLAEWLHSPENREAYNTWFTTGVWENVIPDDVAVKVLSVRPGYARLEDSYEPEYYRMGYFKGSLTIENLFDAAGRATLTFNCMPQKFLKEGEQPIVLETSAQFLKNKTNFSAKPIIIVNKISAEYTDIDFDFFEDADNNPYYYADAEHYSYTKYKVTIDPIDTAEETTRLLIDCENQNAMALDEMSNYTTLTNRNLNNYIRFRGDTGACPALDPGVTQINFTRITKIKSIKIIPRWYTI